MGCFHCDPACGKKSKLDAVPGLVMYLNHSPFVFGMPGTVTEPFGKATQLTGDWNGARCDMVKRGILVDVYSTSGYLNTTDGGLRTGGCFSQSTDLTVNLDTGHLGLWPEGIFHINLQSRYGSSLRQQNNTGALVPPNGAWLYPQPADAQVIGLSEYYLFQYLTDKNAVLLGKADVLYLADQNLFASNYRYQFMNDAFQVNLPLAEYFHPVAWVGAWLWEPVWWLKVLSAVGDPRSSSQNFAKDAFKHVSVWQEFDFMYKPGGLLGTLTAGWAWTSQPLVDLSNPLRINLWGAPGTRVSTRKVDSSYMFYCNFAQYLYVADSLQVMEAKMAQGLPVRGWGLFGRLSIGPKKTNLISCFGSLGMGVNGIDGKRPYDQFGAGWYYCHVSQDFKNDIDTLISFLDRFRGRRIPKVRDEQGGEAYYAFAITPALIFTADFQYVRRPLQAHIRRENHATVVGCRLQSSF